MSITRKCIVNNCKNIYLCKNYCKPHYDNNRKHGDPLFAENKRKNKPTICIISGCNGKGKLKRDGTRYLIFGKCLRHSGEDYRNKTKDSYLQSSEYTTWTTMKQRCSNTNYYQFHLYGGRGIKVCERWLNSFWNFYEDMGKKPAPKYSIDRIDVNKGYTPENCRWATPKEQAINKQVTNRSSGGFRGIYKSNYGTYKAGIRNNYIMVNIGTYKTLEEAISARLMAESVFWS